MRIAASNTTEPVFSWYVAFLELNGKKIAYSFWYEYNKTAFDCKTSFNDNYKSYYPGVYINNAVILEIFGKSTIKNIDMMTNLPFHYRWLPTVIPRSRIILSKSVMRIIVMKALQCKHFASIRQKLSQATLYIQSK
jgi:hypothetical protein